MTKQVKKLYKSGKKNALFLQEIYIADKDIAPGIFADDFEKHIFSSIYYGWLVGMYKDKWKLHI